MRITVNGDTWHVDEPSSIATLVRRVTGRERPGGCAVALNGELVTQSAWTRTRLGEGDRVEVLEATAGG